MATQVGGSVVWNLDIDSSKFEAGLRKAKIEVDSFGKNLDNVGRTSGDSFASNLSGSFDSVSRGLGSLLKGIGIFSVGSSVGFGAATLAAFNQVKQVENATFALKAYETSADKVNNVLSDLVKFARSDLGVLFQRQDLFDAASTLKVYGDETDKLVDHVKVLSKGVAIGKTNFQELSEILGQVIVSGKLTSDSFDVLARRGIKLPDVMRNASVSADQLFNALDKALPDALLEGRANTIDGAMIRLQSSFRDLGSAILGVDKDTSKFIVGGLGDTFVKSIDQLRTSLKDPTFLASLRDLGTSIASFAKDALPKLVDGFKFIIKNRKSVVAAIVALATAFVAIKIAGIVTAIANFAVGLLIATGAITSATAAQWGFNVAMAANPVLAVILAITLLIAALAFLQIKFNIIGKFLKFISPVVQVVSSVIKDLWANMKQLGDLIAKELAPVFDFIGNHAEAFKKILLALYIVGILPILTIIAEIVLALKVMGVVIGFVADHFDGFKNVIVTILKVAFAPLTIAIEIIRFAAEKLGITWSDVWNAISTVVKDAKVKIVQAIDSMKLVAQEFIDKFIEVKDNIQRIWSDVKNTTTTTIDKVKEKFNDLKDGFNNTFDSTRKALEPWKRDFTGTLISTLDQARGSLNKYSDETISKWQSQWENFKETAKTKLDTTKENVSQFFKTTAENISKGFDRFGENIKTFFDNLPENIRKGFDKFGESVTNFFKGLPEKIKTAIGNIGEFIKRIFTPDNSGDVEKSGQSVTDSFVDGAKKQMSSIETIRKVGDSIVQLMAAAVLAASIYIIDAGVRTISFLVKGMIDAAGLMFGKGIEIIGKFLDGIASSGVLIYQKGTEIIGNLVGGIASGITRIITVTGNIVLTIISTLAGAVANTWQKGFELSGGFAGGISSGLGLVADAARGILGTVTGFFGNTYSWLYSAGQYVVWGFKDGMLSVINSVRSAAGDIGAAVRDRVKGVLGINSPSKVFYGFGQNITQGLIDGIDSGMAKVNLAAKGLSAGMAAPNIVDQNGSTAGNTGGTTINQTNNVYNEIDMDKNLRDLAWRIAN